ncbi:hypothetical protein EPUS_07432 [Endocarpon pusillum Z07020]|uniref:Protein SQS1 n=1 Tax=Endocarpon pusillum (strain Z07020 / HMAS-L-300199) TaxID=1263415 RepID=U1HQN1_ENDPU|nr:uncharacterized protein EPUS_07432 [Endocarpon pusillum Z07020]ERF71404.1 hypothetical protein EPUS_07432 [Endocarpon pusillum Z07020]
MGSGAARKRASRQKSRQAAPTTSQVASWGSSTSKAPNLDSGSRTQLLQGWNSFSNQDQLFTLSQEARNTHRSAWKDSNRLRDTAIQFVSGGNLHQDNPNREEKEEEADAEHYENAPEQIKNVPMPLTNQPNEQTPFMNKEEVVGASIEVETVITEQAEQGGFPDANRNPSFVRTRSISASSTSSSEVILFAGRGNHQKKKRKSPPPSMPGCDGAQASSGSRLKDDSSSPKRLPANLPSRLKPDATEFVPTQLTESGPRYSLRTQDVVGSTSFPKDVSGSTNHSDQKRSKGRPRRDQRTFLESYDHEEEIIRDYIENIKENQSTEEDASSDSNEHPDTRESGLHDGKAQTGNSVPERKSQSKSLRDEWSSDDLRDFDELETSEDELTDPGGVFSRRERPSGRQYLVTPKGQSTDFAKWILQEKLTSTVARELIIAFEETHVGEPDESEKDIDDEDDEGDWDVSSSDDPENEALNDLIRDHDSEHNENERILEHTSRMTDADLARILNKQAELGIETDEIVLFDGALEESQDFISFSAKAHTSNRTRSKQNRRSKGTFPSAEAFADVLDEDPYNGFDVMDFDRPSLKPKKRGRKSANGLPFELEDDELADQLAQSWANDRAKKAMKKVEREELRQAGLLGAKSRKGNRIDLQTKYKNSGMDMDQVKAEIRTFLLDDDRESLALAPMQSPQRAQVHLLAKALYLKSHSQGKGDTRFPILTKTDFSGRYDEDNISQIDALLAKRKFSTYWGKKDRTAPKSRGGGKARRSGGGGVAAGASYMDGDVVGASAPELGSENRGRAMLEKMGWSSGMGIGKVGNKGRVEVIQHVVKNTKAGLG